MYKNGLEKFLVGNSLQLTVIKETTENETHYVLVRISLFGKGTYAICALGDGYAFEIIGEDDTSSREFFETMLSCAPSPCHIYDVVSDFRREREF